MVCHGDVKVILHPDKVKKGPKSFVFLKMCIILKEITNSIILPTKFGFKKLISRKVWTAYRTSTCWIWLYTYNNSTGWIPPYYNCFSSLCVKERLFPIILSQSMLFCFRWVPYGNTLTDIELHLHNIQVVDKCNQTL